MSKRMTFGRQAVLVVFCSCAISVWGGGDDLFFPGFDDSMWAGETRFDELAWAEEAQRILNDVANAGVELNALMNPRALNDVEQYEVAQYFRQFGFEEDLIRSLSEQVTSRVLQQGGVAHDMAIRVLLEYFRVPNVDDAVLWVFDREFIESAQSVHAFSYAFLRSHFLEGEVLDNAMLSLTDYINGGMPCFTALRVALFSVHEWYRDANNLNVVIRIYQRYMDQGLDSVRARLYSCMLTHGANPHALGDASEWFMHRYTDSNVVLYFEAFFEAICISFSFPPNLRSHVVRRALLLSQSYPSCFEMFWVAMFHSLGVQGIDLVRAWPLMRQYLQTAPSQWVAFERALIAVSCDSEDFYRRIAILQEGYACASEYDRLELVFGLILAMRHNAQGDDLSAIQGFARVYFSNLSQPNGPLLPRNES